MYFNVWGEPQRILLTAFVAIIHSFIRKVCEHVLLRIRPLTQEALTKIQVRRWRLAQQRHWAGPGQESAEGLKAGV